MADWFSTLHIMEKICLYLALPSTLILLIQTIMLVFGGDSADDGGLDADTSGVGGDVSVDVGVDMDMDMDFGADISIDTVDTDLSGGSPQAAIQHTGAHTHSHGTDVYDLRFITMRGVIAFLTVAGWTGVLCMEIGLFPLLSGLIAVVCGFGAMVGIAYLIQFLMSLQSSGNIDYRGALGMIADVYLTIPAQGAGTGKISLTLGGALSECDAVTEGDAPIQTGRLVRVLDVVNDSVMVVEPVSEGDRGAVYERSSGDPREN